MSVRDALPCRISTRFRSQTGSSQIRQYVLEKEIGRGGMAVVYRAQHLNPSRDYLRVHGDKPRIVAIKYPHPEVINYGERALDRFCQEAELASKIKHPNIARVYGIFVDEEDQPFFEMEFVQNAKTLTDLIDEAKRSFMEHGFVESKTGKIKGSLIPLPELMPMLMQILEALTGLHDHAIVHRDLKGDNFLVTERDGARRMVLTDFGIAKSLAPRDPSQSDLTHVGSIIGTPNYMAPEQTGAPRLHPTTKEMWGVGPHTDIWAFGVIVYECVSGELPYTGETPQFIMGLIREDSEKPHPIDDYVEDLHPAIRELIERCMRKNPWERPASVREVKDILRRVSASIAPPPPPPPPPSSKRLRTRPTRVKSDPPPHVQKPETIAPTPAPRRLIVSGVLALLTLFVAAAVFVFRMDSESRTTLFAFDAPPPLTMGVPVAPPAPIVAATASPPPSGAATAVTRPTASPSAQPSKRKPDPGPPSGSKAKQQFEQGLLYQKQGQCKLAQAEMYRILAQFPAFPPPFRVIAECALKLNNTKEAQEYGRRYQTFEGVDPLSPELQKLLNP